MSDKKKDSKEKLGEANGEMTISTTMRDLSNDPVIVKKVESARKTIEKYGLPKELLND
ncbi:hypothetical protein [Niastella yeongjuensis]|uniref:hypothetical protein n=1 Tax=Niastella yeongjuensis TaxID=354355 RepID=UPI0008B0796C|nr:hypothetical protein [Niastella yeongjuensis]SEP49076.1 hypothetical protein SAMN05660816_06883 [Niastella yeongjuensis]